MSECQKNRREYYFFPNSIKCFGVERDQKSLNLSNTKVYKTLKCLVHACVAFLYSNGKDTPDVVRASLGCNIHLGRSPVCVLPTSPHRVGSPRILKDSELPEA